MIPSDETIRMEKMLIEVRGRKIRTYAKAGNKQHYVRLYESFSDERLDQLEQESREHEQANPIKALES